MSIAATADSLFDPSAQRTADPAPGSAAAASSLRPSVRQIVRSALHADALTSPSAERAVLERELDRLQPLIAIEQAALGQQLNWTMLSQALLLNVFVVALVFGTPAALPGKRWLLAGIALFATVVAVLSYLAFRGNRQSLRGLMRRRTELEASLRALGRDAVFVAGDTITRGLGAFAGRLLPAIFVAGWIAVSIYALATPSGARAMEDAAAAAGAGASAAAQRPRAGPARPVAAAPSAAPAAAADEPDAGTAPPRRSGFKW
jgi:hypothetical protein